MHTNCVPLFALLETREKKRNERTRKGYASQVQLRALRKGSLASKLARISPLRLTGCQPYACGLGLPSSCLAVPRPECFPCQKKPCEYNDLECMATPRSQVLPALKLLASSNPLIPTNILDSLPEVERAHSCSSQRF
eukprot:1161762-Pelagomonas_calceolata.AAC.10